MTDAVREGRPPPVLSLAERLTFLFDHVRRPPTRRGRPDGTKHSDQEVADFVATRTGKSCSREHINNLRHGTADNPSVWVVEAIAAFFDVSAAYFVDDEAAREIQAQLELAVAMRDTGLRALALRAITTDLAAGAATIPVEGLRAVHDLIRQLATASRPAVTDAAGHTQDPATLPNSHHQDERH